MSNRRTTAQINAHTLSRLKEVAKQRNRPLYALLDEAVKEYLTHHPNGTDQRISAEQLHQGNILRTIQQIKPLVTKNKLLTSGLAFVIWIVCSEGSNLFNKA